MASDAPRDGADAQHGAGAVTERATTDPEVRRRIAAFLAVNREVYNDAGKQRPSFPGGSDDYRKREYSVNRETQEWHVDDSKQIAQQAQIGNQRADGYKGPEL